MVNRKFRSSFWLLQGDRLTTGYHHIVMIMIIVADPDSKLQKEFIGICKLLLIAHHQSTTGNHNAIFVARFNNYLNASLSILCEERGTVRVFTNGVLMLTYAWNFAPVSSTDLPVVAREYKFPIDFVTKNYLSSDAAFNSRAQCVTSWIP